MGQLVPTHVDVHWAIVLDEEEDSEAYKFVRVAASIPLLDDQQDPLWYVHPSNHERIDVAVLELSDEAFNNFLAKFGARRLLTKPVNSFDWIDFEPSVGDEAFVLGYPLSLDGGHGFPIWKKATIATEPSFDINDLPLTLIDTATRKGMSGAPVLIRRNGITYPRGTEPPKNSIGDNAHIGESNAFFGVYSGRLNDPELTIIDNEFQAQIGRVWKAPVIEEIIAGKVRGISGGEKR